MVVNNEKEIAKRFINLRKVEDFHLLHDLYFESLSFFAYGYLKDQHDAEDVVQDAFVQLWEQKKFSDDNLAGFLYTCVRNNCLMFLRKQNSKIRYLEHQKSNTDEMWEEDESMRMIKAEYYREIFKKVEALPEKMRKVFIMSYVSKMKEKEIAEKLSISVNSIKTHKQRAKQILRKELMHLFQTVLLSFF